MVILEFGKFGGFTLAGFHAFDARTLGSPGDGLSNANLRAGNFLRPDDGIFASRRASVRHTAQGADHDDVTASDQFDPRVDIPEHDHATRGFFAGSRAQGAGNDFGATL